MVKTSKEALLGRMRCWTCGQLGHLSQTCPRRSEASKGKGLSKGKSGPGKIAPAFFNVGFVYEDADSGTIEHPNLAVISGLWPQVLLQTDGELGLVDTGAVNGMFGLGQFVQYFLCQLYEEQLGFILEKCPVMIGGVGGAAEILMAATVPMALGGVPGLLAAVIASQELPALLPIGLWDALGAHIKLGCHRSSGQRSRRRPLPLRGCRRGALLWRWRKASGTFSISLQTLRPSA